MITQGASLS